MPAPLAPPALLDEDTSRALEHALQVRGFDVVSVHGVGPKNVPDAVVVEHVPSGEKVVELWLPQFGDFRLRGLVTGRSDGCAAAPQLFSMALAGGTNSARSCFTVFLP